MLDIQLGSYEQTEIHQGELKEARLAQILNNRIITRSVRLLLLPLCPYIHQLTDATSRRVTGMTSVLLVLGSTVSSKCRSTSKGTFLSRSSTKCL